MVSDTDLAYMAGIVDGEGCISIWSHVKRAGFSRRKTETTSYNLRLHVTNTNIEMLEWIKVRFGGRIVQVKRLPEAQKTRKITWYWTIYNKQAMAIINRIYPYLQIKRAQADVASSFRRTFDDNHWHSTRPLPKYVNMCRDMFKEDLHRLNKRGCGD